MRTRKTCFMAFEELSTRWTDNSLLMLLLTLCSFYNALYMLFTVYCVLQLAATEEVDNSVRVKALEGISWLVSMKKKALQKMNLIQPILDVVFSLMCKCEDSEEDLEDSEETEKAASYAARVCLLALMSNLWGQGEIMFISRYR